MIKTTKMEKASMMKRLMVVVGLLAPSAASAEGLPSQSVPEFGKITVHAMKNADTSPAPLSGVVFELWPIEGVAPGSEQANALIKDPSKVTKAQLGTVIRLAATDGNGATGLSEVSLGMYLLIEAGQSGQPMVGYSDMVFAMPTKDGDSTADVLSYNLSIYPKIPSKATPSPTPTATPTPTPTEEPKGTQTGDELRERTLWMLAVGLGLFAAAGGVMLLGARRNRGEHS